LAEVIRQLDVRRPQVRVEAVVVEISDTAAKELGVQFLLAGREGSGVPFAATNFSTDAPNVLALTGALVGDEAVPEDSPTLDLLRDAAVSSLLGPFGGALGFGGNIDDALFGIIVNAVKRDQNSNVLSTPSVMTLDNQEASILVGSEVPISTGSVLPDTNINPFVTIEGREIGVRLAVKPQINSGGAITLNIRQEVSSLDGITTAVFDEPVFSTREIETTVLVDDGEIVALGGLLDQTESLGEERVPILGDIPLLGRLFRNTTRSRDRTNLMVFIRPRIVNTVADARAIAGPLYRQLAETQRAQSRQGVSSLEEVIRGYMGATPPDEVLLTPPPPPPAPPPPPPGEPEATVRPSSDALRAPTSGLQPAPLASPRFGAKSVARMGPIRAEAPFEPLMQGALPLSPAVEQSAPCVSASYRAVGGYLCADDALRPMPAIARRRPFIGPPV